MKKKHAQVEIAVIYPPLKGCILKAYKLQQLLGASFGAVVELEERIGEQLSVSLNGAPIYAQSIDENLRIDTEKIIKAVCECNVALQETAELEAEDEFDNDPEHRRWLNSVCSGD
ncbi:MAG: hypothetical protein ACR2PB_03455 [Desulfocapsaceae bacterium]